MPLTLQEETRLIREEIESIRAGVQVLEGKEIEQQYAVIQALRLQLKPAMESSPEKVLELSEKLKQGALTDEEAISVYGELGEEALKQKRILEDKRMRPELIAIWKNLKVKLESKGELQEKRILQALNSMPASQSEQPPKSEVSRVSTTGPAFFSSGPITPTVIPEEQKLEAEGQADPAQSSPSF